MRKEVLLVSVLVVVVIVGLSYGLITGNVVADYGIPSGDSVVLYLPMNGDANDYSGNGYGGTIVGDVDCTDDGKIGGGCRFDGDGDYVDFGDVDFDGGLTELSVSAWVKSNENGEIHGSNDFIVDRLNGPGTNSWNFFWGANDDVQFRVLTPSGQYRGWFTDGITEMDRWYHVVGVFGNDEVKVYVDGVLGSVVGSSTGAIIETNNRMNVGAYWDGEIDEVIIWDRALTEQEIVELYNSEVTIEPEICVEDWSCPEWGACVNSVQNRGCVDGNGCGTVVNRPEEERSCVVVGEVNETGDDMVEEEIIEEETQPDDSEETGMDGIGEDVVVDGSDSGEEIIRDERNVVERVVDGVVDVVDNVFGFFVGLFGAQEGAGNTIYVDNLNAGDCVGDYNVNTRLCDGSDGDKFDTLQEAADVVSAGDSVLVRGGTYTKDGTCTWCGTVEIGSNGTSGNPITFSNYGNEQVIVDARNLQWYALRIGNPLIAAGAPGTSNIIIDGLHLTGGNRNGVYIWKSDDVVVRDVEVFGNNQEWEINSAANANFAGIDVRAGSDIVIEDSRVYNNGYGIMMWEDPQEAVAYEGCVNCTVQRNFIYSNVNGENWGNAGGLAVRGAEMCLIQDNVFYDNPDGAAGGMFSINCRVLRNIGVHQWQSQNPLGNPGNFGNKEGFKWGVRGGGGNLLAFNLAIYNGQRGFEQAHDVGDILLNNVAYQNNMWGYLLDGRSTIMFNNIGFEDFRNDPSSSNKEFAEGGVNTINSTSVISDNNFFEDETSIPLVGIYGRVQQNSHFGNPGFVDAPMSLDESDPLQIIHPEVFFAAADGGDGIVSISEVQQYMAGKFTPQNSEIIHGGIDISSAESLIDSNVFEIIESINIRLSNPPHPQATTAWNRLLVNLQSADRAGYGDLSGMKDLAGNVVPMDEVLDIGVVQVSESAPRKIYVDNQLTNDCVGDYSIVNRDCSGSDGEAYDTPQEAADSSLEPGDVVEIRGGTYVNVRFPTFVNSPVLDIANLRGSPGMPITFRAYNGENVVLDGQHGTATSHNRVIQVEGSEYLTFDGFVIENANNDGIYFDIVNYTTINDVVARYNGIGASKSGVNVLGSGVGLVINNSISYGNGMAGFIVQAYASDFGGPDSVMPRDCVISYLIAYNNTHDPEDADGIQTKGARNCTISHTWSFGNGDDGYDLFATSNFNTVEYAVAFAHPSAPFFGTVMCNPDYIECTDFGDGTCEYDSCGDGNGFKPGVWGSSPGPPGGLNNTLRHSISFNNKFGLNNNAVGQRIYHSIFFNNSEWGIAFDESTGNEGVAIMKNSIIYGNAQDVGFNLERANPILESDYNYIGDGTSTNDHPEESGHEVNSLDGTIVGPPQFSDLTVIEDLDGNKVPDVFEGTNGILDRALSGDAFAAINWGEGILSQIFSLDVDSPLIDNGTWISGYHCASAEEVGDCVTWYGAAPDIGAFEFVPQGGSCTIDLECNDNIACTVDSCSGGSCVSDMGPCLCGQADVNGDGDVNVLDLSFVALSFNAGDLLGDVNGDGEVDILDLVFVASRIDGCAGY